MGLRFVRKIGELLMPNYEANVKLWLIRKYFRDLTEFFAGDEGRFTRMVGREGRHFDTASPKGWAQHIQNCTTEAVVAIHGDEIATIDAQLRDWGLLDG